MRPTRGRLDSLRRSDRAGTVSILVGTIVLVVTAVVYQIVAGRALGTVQFAPIGVIWTLQFIVTSVLLLPVQNLVTRQLALAGGSTEYLRPAQVQIGIVFVAAVVTGVAFAAVTLERFFLGDARYVALVALIMTGRGLVSLARGFLTGRRRFFAFGETLAVEGVALLGTGLAAAALQATSLLFAGCIALATFAPLLVRPFAVDEEPAPPPGAAEHSRPPGFLGYLIAATAASQLVLAGAPIVVGLIGGTATTVSVVFATFTLFRGPVTSAYNFVARALPDFTEMVRDGRGAEIRQWSRRITLSGLALAAVGSVAGWFAASPIVGFLFGTDFEPGDTVGTLVGLGVGAGLGALFTGQIHIADGRTRALAVRWGLSLVVAVVVVAIPFADPEVRVAAGFAAGELAALVLLGLGPRTAAPRLGR